jgi:hypothetical protein
MELILHFPIPFHDVVLKEAHGHICVAFPFCLPSLLMHVTTTGKIRKQMGNRQPEGSEGFLVSTQRVGYEGC